MFPAKPISRRDALRRCSAGVLQAAGLWPGVLRAADQTAGQMRPLNAEALLDRLRAFNVQAVFNGHYHGFTEKQWQRAPVTTNRCCTLRRDNHDGSKAQGCFVCTVRDGRVTREFIEFKPA